MALGFEKAQGELSRENNILHPQKMTDNLTSPQCSTPGNPVESLIPAQRSQEGPAALQQNGQLQIMYCKDLVYQNDTEFSFEELRAQRYYRALHEKATYLNKLKHDLQLQIEEKQRLLQQRNSAAAQQIVGEETGSESAGMCESVSGMVMSDPFKIYSNQESDCKSSSRSSVSCEEDTSGGGSDSKLQMTKPFAVFDENPQANKISSSSNRKSLKLPTLNLRPSKSKVELSTDRDASLSRSEEPIINAHWNKTLCRSPNDTSDFARAAPLASTPFGGAERQIENLNTTAPDAPPAPNPDPAPEPRKLSPIQEISHDWGGTSFAVVTQEAIRRSDGTEISRSVETAEVLPGDAVKADDVCSLDVRSRLLHQVDMTSFPCFHRKTGRLPQACGEDDLDLDGEKLFYCSKLGGQKNYTRYSSRTGTVLLKVDSSSVPWDFFISSKIRSSLITEKQEVQVQISCYMYENGCLTLWRVPHGVIAEDLLTEPVARPDVSLLVLQLLKMVKRIHSCQIVHGDLKPETLYFYHSDIIALDFSRSVDLQLQTDVRSAQLLSSAQKYIKQGLLLPSASPYQADLVGVAEIVHMLVLNRPLKVMHGNSGWSLDEDSESYHSPVDPVWKNFLHMILNPGELSTELILSTLISNMRNIL